MNLLLSHPDVCLSAGETHKVFKGTHWDPAWRRVKKRLFYDIPIRLLTCQDLFSPRSLRPRRPVFGAVKKYIDYILYYGRFKSMIATHNLYKYENVRYSKEELAKCRLLTKGLNGTIYMVDAFREMYPDGVFFGLVRNGLALCDGYVRRKWSAENFAYTYNAVIEKMLKCEMEMPNYHIVRYEEMVKQPSDFLKEIYRLAELDLQKIKKIRLQSKPMLTHDGKHILSQGSDRQVFWYDLCDLHKHIRSDIDKNQIAHLSAQDKDIFLTIAGRTMEKLKYSTLTVRAGG
jgi:hypothetical protein